MGSDCESVLRGWHESLQEYPEVLTLAFTFIKKKPQHAIFKLSSVDSLIKYVDKVDFLSLYVFDFNSSNFTSRVGQNSRYNEVLLVVNRVCIGDVVDVLGQSLLGGIDER